MENLYLRIAEFWYKNPQWFLITEIKKYVLPISSEEVIFEKHFEQAYNAYKYWHNASLNPPFFVLEEYHWGYTKCKYCIKSEILFSYIDYLELQEARKSSKSAMKWAIAAILINIVAIAVQIYTSKSTQIDKIQFDEIKNIISSEVKK